MTRGRPLLWVVVLGCSTASLRFLSLMGAQNPAARSPGQAEESAMSKTKVLAGAGGQDSAKRSSSLGRLAGVVVGAGAVALVVALVARKRILTPGPSVPAGVELPPPPLDHKLSLPMPAAGTPAGWLPDPASGNGNGRSRYFDGHAWTEQLRDWP